MTPGALEVREAFWSEGLPLLALEPALLVRDLGNYLSFQGEQVGTVLLPAGTNGWAETFERLGLWATEVAEERCRAWIDELLAAWTPTSRLMAFRLAELWADRHAAALAGKIRQDLSAAFDDRYALDRDPFEALSVVSAIATSFADDLGIHKGLRVFQVDMEEAGATPERLLIWLSARRSRAPLWEPPKALVIDGDDRLVERLRLVANPGQIDCTKVVRDVRAFFSPVLHLLDPRHRSWILEKLDVEIAFALENAEPFVVQSSRELTCCGGQLVVTRAGHRWFVIQEFAYC